MVALEAAALALKAGLVLRVRQTPEAVLAVLAAVEVVRLALTAAPESSSSARSSAVALLV